MFVTDESGFGLAGALDGQNQVFTTTRAMRTDLPVEVFINGDRMIAGLEDGYVVADARTVRLRVPPVEEDTVVVKFSVDPPPIGIPGGTPQIMQAQVMGIQVVVGAQVVPDGAEVVVIP